MNRFPKNSFKIQDFSLFLPRSIKYQIHLFDQSIHMHVISKKYTNSLLYLINSLTSPSESMEYIVRAIPNPICTNSFIYKCIHSFKLAHIINDNWFSEQHMIIVCFPFIFLK